MYNITDAMRAMQHGTNEPTASFIKNLKVNFPREYREHRSFALFANILKSC